MAVQSTANKQTAQQIYSSQARQAVQAKQYQQNLYSRNAARAAASGARQGQINADTAAIAAAENQNPAVTTTTMTDTDYNPGGGNGGNGGNGGGANTATYIDESGNKQTGVYTQASENAGLAASQPAQGTHWDSMRSHYQQQYDEQKAANDAAYEAAAARAREATQQNIDALNKGYEATNRQLYRDYMEHQRLLPQQMAARGYSGGLAESSQLRLRNSYEEGLNENERARMGQISSAEAALAQQLYEAQATATAANQQANQQRLSYLTALQEQQYQDQQQRAATLASAGDFSGYKDLGYSDDQIQYLSDIWARQNPALAYSLGKISAGTYYSLTGAYPPGYSTGSTRSSDGGGGGSRRTGESSGGSGKAVDWSKYGYSDQDVANAAANGYAVYASPLRTANALQRAENKTR